MESDQQQVETGGLFTVKKRELQGIRCASCGSMPEGSLPSSLEGVQPQGPGILRTELELAEQMESQEGNPAKEGAAAEEQTSNSESKLCPNPWSSRAGRS